MGNRKGAKLSCARRDKRATTHEARRADRRRSKEDVQPREVLRRETLEDCASGGSVVRAFWFRLHHEARNEPLPGLVRRGEEGSPGPPPPQRQHEAELGPRKSLA